MNDGDQTIELPGMFVTDASSIVNLDTITPNNGLPVFGGFNFTITGTNFKIGNEEPSVVIGGNECEVKSFNNTEIICTAPASSGSPYVYIATSESNLWIFNVINFGFGVTSIDTDSGSFAGGTKVKITGTGFGEKTELVEVQFDGGISKCEIVSVSDKEIFCETPAASKVVAIDNNGINKGI